jgi:ketosteroid isomerase-like protein
MEEGMVKTQTEVEALFDNRSEAIWTKEIDRLMSLYSPDIVYFDLVPPLQYVAPMRCARDFLTGSKATTARSARRSPT